MPGMSGKRLNKTKSEQEGIKNEKIETDASQKESERSQREPKRAKEQEGIKNEKIETDASQKESERRQRELKKAKGIAK